MGELTFSVSMWNHQPTLAGIPTGTTLTAVAATAEVFAEDPPVLTAQTLYQ